jgi:hypothetical protein
MKLNLKSLARQLPKQRSKVGAELERIDGVLLSADSQFGSYCLRRCKNPHPLVGGVARADRNDSEVIRILKRKSASCSNACIPGVASFWRGRAQTLAELS